MTADAKPDQDRAEFELPPIPDFNGNPVPTAVRRYAVKFAREAQRLAIAAERARANESMADLVPEAWWDWTKNLIPKTDPAVANEPDLSRGHHMGWVAACQAFQLRLKAEHARLRDALAAPRPVEAQHAAGEAREPLSEQAFIALVLKSKADLNAMGQKEWDGMRAFMRLVEQAHGIATIDRALAAQGKPAGDAA